MSADRFIVAISGSRGIVGRAIVCKFLDESAEYFISRGWWPEFRVGDYPRGVDPIALDWLIDRGYEFVVYTASNARAAELEGLGIPVVRCADWDVDGKSAGPIRNYAMILGSLHTGNLGKADALLAIWDGAGPGTKNAKACARLGNVPIHSWGVERVAETEVVDA
jgi:hypothetical protein